MKKHDTIPLNDLFSVDALAAAFPGVITAAGLRWQLRSRATNGLAQATVRIGKKLMVSRTRYEQWLAQQAGTR